MTTAAAIDVSDTGSEENTFESHLDDLTGSGDIDLSDDEDEGTPAQLDAKEEESAKEDPDEKDDADPQPDLAAEAEPEEDEEDPGNLRLEESEPKPEESKPEANDTSQAEKREAGYQKEIAKLRAKNRQHTLAAAQASAPTPTIDQAPPQPSSSVPVADPGAESGGIPVVVSPDGQNVYVDQAKLDASNEASARRVYEEMARPTPEQIYNSETRQLASDFVSSNPERNQPIFERAEKANNYLFMALQDKARELGVQPQTVQDIQTLMHQTGVDKQVGEMFPEIAPILDEFVEAYASDNRGWKRSVLDRIGVAESDVAPSGESETLEKVAGAPQSLARKGGSRSVSPNSEEMEFESLEKAFRANPIDFPDKKYKRMNALGKKLDMPGMD